MNTIKFLSKVGMNRARARIWLEGTRLTKAGFKWNTLYKTVLSLDTEQPCIMLTLDPTGDRKVAGRTRNDKEIPILDLCSSEITKFTGGCDYVQVEIENGQILITQSDKKREQPKEK